MLRNAITHCPEQLWREEGRFYYLSYHTTIFLDYYLSRPVQGFDPALPFTLVAEDRLPAAAVDDVIPNRHYRREEVLSYLNRIRDKCKRVILETDKAAFTETWIREEIPLHGLCPPPVENYSLLEILFYNLRHVQHHTAQLNYILRQGTGWAPDWVSLAEAERH